MCTHLCTHSYFYIFLSIYIKAISLYRYLQIIIWHHMVYSGFPFLYFEDNENPASVILSLHFLSPLYIICSVPCM